MSNVGHPVQRRNGDKVHICIRCNFPVAVYGRLEPCQHIFCLTCARTDGTCFMCEEKIIRVRRVEMLEGVYICGACRCLKSFMERAEFEAHVTQVHKDLDHQPQQQQQQQQQTAEEKKASPAFERQSRQQQFRNAQQQRQLDQMHGKLKSLVFDSYSTWYNPTQ